VRPNWWSLLLVLGVAATLLLSCVALRRFLRTLQEIRRLRERHRERLSRILSARRGAHTDL
jgi:hypothetical protein